MFSQPAEYTLRAVVWLAQRADEDPASSKSIAEGTQVSPSYLSKILQTFGEAEIVSSRRGAGGGFEFIEPL